MNYFKTFVSASLAAATLSGCQKEQPEKTNILFILVDDMQSDAIAALGNRDTYTRPVDSRGNGFYTYLYERGAVRSVVNAQPGHADDGTWGVRSTE